MDFGRAVRNTDARADVGAFLLLVLVMNFLSYPKELTINNLCIQHKGAILFIVKSLENK